MNAYELDSPVPVSYLRNYIMDFGCTDIVGAVGVESSRVAEKKQDTSRGTDILINGIMSVMKQHSSKWNIQPQV
jgi:hypothetical protein